MATAKAPPSSSWTGLHETCPAAAVSVYYFGSGGSVLAADEELIARFQGSDESAFDELAKRYAAQGLRLARSYLGSDADAEDVVQEALVAFWRVLRRWRPGASPGTWFYRTVVNLSRSTLRARRRWRAVPISDELAAPPSADKPGATAGAVESALQSLTERERAVLSLKFDSGLSSEEMGRVLGISASTVRVHLSRALRALREKLRPG